MMDQVASEACAAGAPAAGQRMGGARCAARSAKRRKARSLKMMLQALDVGKVVALSSRPMRLEQIGQHGVPLADALGHAAAVRA